MTGNDFMKKFINFILAFYVFATFIVGVAFSEECLWKSIEILERGTFEDSFFYESEKFFNNEGLICHVSDNQYLDSKGHELSEENIANIDATIYSKEGFIADGNTRLIVRVQVNRPGSITFSINEDMKNAGAILEDIHRNTKTPTSGIATTKVSEEIYQASAVLIAPKSSPYLDRREPYPFFRLDLRFIEDGVNTISTSQVLLKVFPTPVLLAHGLWGSNAITDMTELWLALKNSDYPFPEVVPCCYDGTLGPSRIIPEIKSVDEYESSIVFKFIANIFLRLNEKRIACTKVDLVGFSLGGLIFREFMLNDHGNKNSIRSYGQGMIRRAITIATPHRGSEIANLAVGVDIGLTVADISLTFAEWVNAKIPGWATVFHHIVNILWDKTHQSGGMNIGVQALRDIETNSSYLKARRDNAFPSGIPIYAIYGKVKGTFVSYLRSMLMKKGLDTVVFSELPLQDKLMSAITVAFLSTVIDKNEDVISSLFDNLFSLLYGGDDHDTTVPEQSARGDFSNENSTGYIGLDYMHAQIHAQSKVQNRVIELLKMTDEDAKKRFKVFSTKNTSIAQNTFSMSQVKTMKQLLNKNTEEHSDEINNVDFISGLNITVDKSALTLSANSTENVTITVTAMDEPIAHEMLFILIDTDKGCKILRANTIDNGRTFKVALQFSRQDSGIMNVSCFASGGKGKVYTAKDNVQIAIIPEFNADEIKSLTFMNALDTVFTNVKSEVGLALFAETLDGNMYDVSSPVMGTVYTLGDKSLASITNEGKVRGLNKGSTTLTAHYKGYVAAVNVEVGSKLVPDYYERGYDGKSWDSAYVIETLEDFRLMSTRLNNGDEGGRYYKLSFDVDLSSETAWESIKSFNGHLDGQNHTVKINSVPLFNIIDSVYKKEDAVIKNLKVIGHINGNETVGGIVNELEGGIIENCTFIGSVEGKIAGGIVGSLSGIIRNSTFTGTVNGLRIAGGLVGLLQNKSKIENCYTLSGSIVSASPASEVSGIGNSFAGGIVGEMFNSDFGTYTTEVKNCISEANILGAEYKGGIIGYADNEEWSEKIRKNISNNAFTFAEFEIGNFTSYYNRSEKEDGDSWETAYLITNAEDFLMMRDSDTRTLAPYASKNKYHKLTTDIELTDIPILVGEVFENYFDGQEHSIKISTTTLKSALFEDIKLTNSRDIAIKNLRIECAISSDRDISILAEDLISGTIENCLVIGNIESAREAAGFVNLIGKNGFIKNCAFSGKIVNRTSTPVGGIASINRGVIEDCFVEGEIRSSEHAGGIVCFLEESGIIRNCKFSGDIAVTVYGSVVGGIAASAEGTSTIENSEVLNGSSITCMHSDVYVGGIVGVVRGGGRIHSCISNAAINYPANKDTDISRYCVYVGGIVGFLGYKADSVNISNNVFSGLENEIGPYYIFVPIMESTELPVGRVNTFYNETLTASGTDPITWSKGESWPAWLSLASDTGILSGTPPFAGTYTFAVTAINKAGKDTESFIIRVEEESAPPEILTETLSNAVTNQPYSLQLQASGTTPITWTLSGKLPAGLTLSDSGLISGTPKKAGKSTFTVTAQNNYGKTSQKYTLQVFDPVSITIASLKAGTIGKSYSVTMRAKGTKTIMWSAEGLPNGLTINGKGKISGKPTVYGMFNVKVRAENGAGSVTKNLTLEIKAIAPKLSGSLKKATLNETYSSGLKVTGSTPITWSIEGNLPDGLTLDTSTGIISGTPTSYAKSGYKITLTATNDGGSKSKKITLKVNGKTPKITAKLPQAIAGENYSAELSAMGSEPITFAADLPEYLTLEGNTISGTVPASVKSFKITVYASNPVKEKMKKNYTVKVSAKKSLPSNLNVDNNTDITEINTGLKSEVVANVPVVSERDVYSHSVGVMIVAELGKISADKEGMYDFEIKLPDYVRKGSELVYIANSDNPSDDDDIAEFYDETGSEIATVPENRRIIISVWLNPETVYNPVIAVKD